MILFSGNKFCQDFSIKWYRYILLEILCSTCFNMCFFANVYNLTVNVKIFFLKISQPNIWHYYCTQLPPPTEEKNKGYTLYKNTSLCVNVILSIFLKAFYQKKIK